MTEYLSDQGFRTDGRKPNELRRIRCSLGIFSQADGSAYLEQGNTKVLAAVYGPHEVILNFRPPGFLPETNEVEKLDRVSVPSPIAIDVLMDTMARDRAHMYLFSV